MTLQTTGPAAPRLQCAVHPSRPAVDDCPVCGRPRCGADVAAVATGCLGCVSETAAPVATVRPPGDLERLVRATLAAYAVALLPPDDPSVQPLAIDYASFRGQPAMVVVLPGSVADKLDVFVVGPGCSRANDSVLFYTSVDKP